MVPLFTTPPDGLADTQSSSTVYFSVITSLLNPPHDAKAFKVHDLSMVMPELLYRLLPVSGLYPSNL